MDVTPHLVPDLQPTEFQVRNRFSLISPGTELALLDAAPDAPSNVMAYPVRPGYCAVGWVTKVGASVTEIASGVVVLHASPHEQVTNLVAAEKHKWIQIPTGCNPTSALLARFYQIAWSCVYALGRPPRTCTISGAGLVGLCAAKLLTHLGVEVTLITGSPGRLKVARALGINATARHVAEWERITCLIDCTGRPEHIVEALNSLRPVSTLVLLGSPRIPVTVDLCATVHRKCLRVVGAHELIIPREDTNTVAGRRGCLREAVSLLSACNPVLLDFIKVVAIADADTAYKALRDRDAGVISFALGMD